MSCTHRLADMSHGLLIAGGCCCLRNPSSAAPAAAAAAAALQGLVLLPVVPWSHCHFHIPPPLHASSNGPPSLPPVPLPLPLPLLLLLMVCGPGTRVAYHPEHSTAAARGARQVTPAALLLLLPFHKHRQQYSPHLLPHDNHPNLKTALYRRCQLSDPTCRPLPAAASPSTPASPARTAVPPGPADHGPPLLGVPLQLPDWPAAIRGAVRLRGNQRG